MGAPTALQPTLAATALASTPSGGRGHQESRAAAPKPPVTPPPGPQKLGTPRGGGASESGSGDDEYAAARPAAAVDEPAQAWSAAAEWSPVNGADTVHLLPT